jgi:hypothetical protein
MPTHKRVIAQAYDEKHIELARYFIPRMAKWCEANGWRHVVRHVHSTDHDYDHDYRKYVLIRELICDHDVVVWSDTDVVPVSGADFTLPEGDIHFSQDNHGLCSGFVAYRSIQWTADFVEGLTSIIPKRGNYRTHEQDCLKLLIAIGECGKHVRMIPETIVANMNSPRMGVPTFFHAWSNTGVTEAINRAAAICNSTTDS